jgi:hypothetical protein
MCVFMYDLIHSFMFVSWSHVCLCLHVCMFMCARVIQEGHAVRKSTMYCVSAVQSSTEMHYRHQAYLDWQVCLFACMSICMRTCALFMSPKSSECVCCFICLTTATQQNTTKLTATQHNTTQHNTIQHNTTQHNSTQYRRCSTNTSTADYVQQRYCRSHMWGCVQ